MKNIITITLLFLTVSINLKAQTERNTNLPPRLGFKMIAFKGTYWFMGGEGTKGK
ncbi:hypothetical protein [Flagellimonas onchidii]|uniref:hypothetical protein n=1 Tax=Flagellimonas onchidii TaxID=2562684 RepID=UPI00197ADEA0|nr:hypothetical protein [Allomuricauda onchidii]